MKLPLYGPIKILKNTQLLNDTNVIRLRSISNLNELCNQDFRLVKNRSDIEYAKLKNDNYIFCVGDFFNASDIDTFQFIIQVDAKFEYLEDGDIIGINPNGSGFRSLYRHSSLHNSFLVTEQCNHYCLMCSQPPKRVDDSWLLNEIMDSIPLIDGKPSSLGFTGGEPLTNADKFIKVLEVCRDLLPSTGLHVLTNGRAFSNSSVANAWANLKHNDLMAGIPIYSSNDTLHDYIVQSEGAFDETIMGILQLKERKQRVEIRLVLHALTTPRLYETCEWFSRNFPFVDHIALMGLENTGFAIANHNELWVDPIEYKFDLGRSVELLNSRGIRTSIYNLPRCVIPSNVWSFAKQSISDWKQGFLEICSDCIERPNCSGFFTSGRPKEIKGIKPFLVSQ